MPFFSALLDYVMPRNPVNTVTGSLGVMFWMKILTRDINISSAFWLAGHLSRFTWCPLLSYLPWAEARRELRATAGDRWGDVPYLLGGWGTRKDVRTGQLLDGPKEEWKPDLVVVKATIRFLEKTGRLSFQQEALLTN